MQCQHAREFFSDYVADELEPALKVSLQGHLAECQTCETEVEGLRRVWRQLDNAPVVDGPADLHERIMQRITAARGDASAAPAGRRGSVELFPRLRIVAWAAAAALLLCCGLGAVSTQRASLGLFWGLFGSGRGVENSSQLAEGKGDWQPRGAGGLLTVRMRPSGGGAAGASTVSYRIGVEGFRDVEARGTLNADGETMATIPFNGKPDAAAVRVNVLLTAADGESRIQSVQVPLARQPSQ